MKKAVNAFRIAALWAGAAVAACGAYGLASMPAGEKFDTTSAEIAGGGIALTAAAIALQGKTKTARARTRAVPQPAAPKKKGVWH